MEITYPFTPGTRAVAQQVNQNFADVKSAVDPLEVAVAEIQDELTGGFILPDGSVDFTRLQSYATYVVSNATNATPIVVTAVAHPFLTGDKVYISGVGGNTAANGTFTVTKIGADTFSLDDSVGNGAFSSNGTVLIVPVADDNIASVAFAKEASFPSASYIDLTLGATGSTYTAPADGYFTITKIATAAGQILQLQQVQGGCLKTAIVASGAEYLACFLPVKKDDSIFVYYSVAGATDYFRFIYAEGSKP